MTMMKYSSEKVRGCLNRGKPYLLMSALQFGSAGMYILAMDALNKGMSQYVFIVYRNAVAAITLGPFALVLERKVRPKMTFRVFSEIMIIAFFEVIIDQCFTLLGMKLTSASFASAVMNSVPSITFVLAIILRMERMKIKEVRCQAKVLGTVVTLGGALLMALYKGPVVTNATASSTSHGGQSQSVNDPTDSHWLMGSLFMLIACSAFSAFYILQAITLKKYPAEMSLATWICLAGSIQSAGVTAYAERHRPHAWFLSWDSTLIAPVYAGIVTSGIQYYVQGLVMKTMGPVFVTAFNPLRMIIVMALGCFILSEQLHLGSIIGGVVVAVGLYLVAWGKYKDVMASSPSSAKDTSTGEDQKLPVTIPTNDHIDNDDHNKAQILLINIADKNSVVESRISNPESQSQ